jgi:hypothetical protein
VAKEPKRGAFRNNRRIAVMPLTEELSTQAAADLLGSRGNSSCGSVKPTSFRVTVAGRTGVFC